MILSTKIIEIISKILIKDLNIKINNNCSSKVVLIMNSQNIILKTYFSFNILILQIVSILTCFKTFLKTNDKQRLNMVTKLRKNYFTKNFYYFVKIFYILLSDFKYSDNEKNKM